MTSPTPADPTSAEHASVERLRERTAREFARVRGDLEALVRIPSVSNADFDQAHVAASAAAVGDLLRGAGFDDVRILTAQRSD
ncbi:MAG: dipeptidase, partial [Cellulomonas sp.]|nr:dipeptidase [Cellulomonas sp.]